MCGIGGMVGEGWTKSQLNVMMSSILHRGPDAQSTYISDDSLVGLGHNRLSIIDLSVSANQPMWNYNKTLVIVFNGEIYNYRELYHHFPDYKFSTKSDTEVVLAAYEKFGAECLDYLIGMFAFAIWDLKNQELFCARDRFGVKPFYFHSTSDNGLYFCSEIKGIHASGVTRQPDLKSWSNYLNLGLYDHSDRTFWRGISSLRAGHSLTWNRSKGLTIKKWYDLSERVGVEFDNRPESEVMDEYESLLSNSIKLRFRSDVPIGVNLSGGLDSGLLSGLIKRHHGEKINAFTFGSRMENYDEVKWAGELARDIGIHHVTYLEPESVPNLALKVMSFQDEPFGGIPTLAYSQLFEKARQNGVIVLLDGQGMDEQWAGYDYYLSTQLNSTTGDYVQGSKASATSPKSLRSEFAQLAEPLKIDNKFPDTLRNMLYKDTFYTKIPRALRFNDRISMMHSTELREPFLDHRLFELAFRQPAHLKIRGPVQKFLLREIANKIIPSSISTAPKRPVQTPQREWLRNELKDWVFDNIGSLRNLECSSWFDLNEVRIRSNKFFIDDSVDNSFFIWQWMSASMTFQSVKVN